MRPHTIIARNVNDALCDACNWLKVAGVRETSRNGPVIRAPGPVLTVYRCPTERVLFHPLRDANPFFHLFESLWMLAGRNDVAYVAEFNARMAVFSDDGETLNAAYGYRWRMQFYRDQLVDIIEHLKENPTSRRAVLGMWDPPEDLNSDSKDLPCNTHVYFEISQDSGALNMTVCNRSNDAIWGCYGANAVQFSVLQEYLAAHLGVAVGEYAQFSNNLHLYLDTHGELLEKLALDSPSRYIYNLLEPSALIQQAETWDRELADFLTIPTLAAVLPTFREPFFNVTAVPMLAAWRLRKAGKTQEALEMALTIAAKDWRQASYEWIERRMK